MSDRDTPTIDFTVAFALGALFGAGAALLLSPEPDLGKVVKKKSRRIRKDAGKHLGKAGERIRESGEEWLGDAEHRIGELTEEISEAVEEGVKTIREAATDELKGLEKKLGRKKGLFR